MLRPYVIASILLILFLASCDSSEPEPEGALFLVRSCLGSSEQPGDDMFRVLIRDPEVIAEAERLITSGDKRIVTGRLRRGDGDFNDPWSWHIDPDSIGFADFTIELCDGCPHHVEDDLDYWIDTVRYYCPWSTEIVKRER